MASLDWSQCSAVESIPGKVSGAWVFRSTRVPVAAVFENLTTSSLEEVLENFHVTREQVQTVLDFAQRAPSLPLKPCGPDENSSRRERPAKAAVTYRGRSHRGNRRFQGWSGLKNGALLDAAEKTGFDLFITADQELTYQQNLTGRTIALVVLSTNN